MGNGDKRGPLERSSTDESLRSERRKTDAELANRSGAMQDVATEVVTEARERADSILSEAREREDRKSAVDDTGDVAHEREREDAALEHARDDADVVARVEIERHRVALASLLAHEREDTDLRLDIERKRADRELTSREDFMAMVSHDLRSLLGGIALGAELLMDVETTKEPFVEVKLQAQRIQRFTSRMTRLVADLMDVASIEAGKLSLVRTNHKAALLMRDSLDAFEPAVRARKISLVCECAIDPETVIELDHERILQVLTNLVSNALKFTPPGGQITMRLERHGDTARFEVADTGCGIAPELLDKIFERYFQSEAGDRRGLGLGLFIAKSIVQAHGGTIWAESTGAGSKLFFTLPLDQN